MKSFNLIRKGFQGVFKLITIMIDIKNSADYLSRSSAAAAGVSVSGSFSNFSMLFAGWYFILITFFESRRVFLTFILLLMVSWVEITLVTYTLTHL